MVVFLKIITSTQEYKMNENHENVISLNEIPHNVLSTVNKHIGYHLACPDFWPEDDWEDILNLVDDENRWDLNIYKDDNGNKMACLYRVEDGTTITNEWFVVYDEKNGIHVVSEDKIENVLEQLKEYIRLDSGGCEFSFDSGASSVLEQLIP
jgi:hypothetical protein